MSTAQKKACDACNKRKIHCALKDPGSPCDWCLHHGLECTFNRLRGRRKRRVPKPSSTDISQRLERIEAALAKAVSNIDAQNSAPTPETLGTPSATGASPAQTLHSSRSEAFSEPSTIHRHLSARSSVHPPSTQPTSASSLSAVSGVAFNQIYTRGRHIGQISLRNGIPIFSEEGYRWLSSVTGEEVDFDRFHNSKRRWPLHLQLHYTAEELYTLPPRRVVETVLQNFKAAAFRLAFPVIDHVLFEKTIDAAYEPNSSLLGSMSAKACVQAFLCINCMFQDQIPDIYYVDGDVHATRAYYLLNDCLEEPSLVTLQTATMLIMYHIFCGRLQSASNGLSIACRMLFVLGGHEYKPTSPVFTGSGCKEREDRLLRLLFWLLYMFDQECSLRSGQPPLLAEEYVDLTPPDDYMKCYDFLTDLDENLSIRPECMNDLLVPHLPTDPQLSYLKGRVFRLLYSTDAMKKSDAAILRDIRELDAELEAWRRTVPRDFRPSLSIPENKPILPPDSKIPRRMRSICLHVEYHYLMMSIHRASERCVATASEDSEEAQSWSRGIQSSVDLAAEASRSTLIYLRAAIVGIPCDLFWFVTLYPIAAVMGLFLNNILKRPLDPQAKLDLRLLASAADITRNVPTQRLGSTEIEHMKQVDDFVAELTRLGEAAISKAAREAVRT